MLLKYSLNRPAEANLILIFRAVQQGTSLQVRSFDVTHCTSLCSCSCGGRTALVHWTEQRRYAQADPLYKRAIILGRLWVQISLRSALLQQAELSQAQGVTLKPGCSTSVRSLQREDTGVPTTHMSGIRSATLRGLYFKQRNWRSAADF